jgi:molecular chaperone HtpG
VLVLADEIDDIVIGSYGKYKDFDIKSVNRAGSDDELDTGDKDEAKKQADAFKPLTDRIKTALGDRVKEVRLSKRLSDSPACIVVDEEDPSLQMERMLKAMGQAGLSEVKPILELNPAHPIVTALKDSTDDAHVKDIATVLLDQALLLEGRDLPDMADYVATVNRLIG